MNLEEAMLHRNNLRIDAEHRLFLKKEAFDKKQFDLFNKSDIIKLDSVSLNNLQKEIQDLEKEIINHGLAFENLQNLINIWKFKIIESKIKSEATTNQELLSLLESLVKLFQDQKILESQFLKEKEVFEKIKEDFFDLWIQDVDEKELFYFKKQLLSWEFLSREEALRKIIALYNTLQVDYAHFSKLFDKDFVMIFHAITMLKTAALKILPTYVKDIHRWQNAAFFETLLEKFKEASALINSDNSVNIMHLEKCINFIKKFIIKRRANALYFLKIYYCTEIYQFFKNSVIGIDLPSELD